MCVCVCTSDDQGGLQGHVGSSETTTNTFVGSSVPGFDLFDEQAAIGQQEDAGEEAQAPSMTFSAGESLWVYIFASVKAATTLNEFIF